MALNQSLVISKLNTKLNAYASQKPESSETTQALIITQQVKINTAKCLENISVQFKVEQFHLSKMFRMQWLALLCNFAGKMSIERNFRKFIICR